MVWVMRSVDDGRVLEVFRNLEDCPEFTGDMADFPHYVYLQKWKIDGLESLLEYPKYVYLVRRLAKSGPLHKCLFRPPREGEFGDAFFVQKWEVTVRDSERETIDA